MSSIEEKILEVKEDIRKLETTIARTEGQIEILVKELKDNFQIDDISKAEDKLEELSAELDKAVKEYNKKLNEIKEEFPDECGDL